MLGLRGAASMEVQSDCSSLPSCEPQPAGRLSRAAFKLFGRRRTAGGVPSFFAVRNKGGTELARSRTHDGLTADAAAEPDGHGRGECSGAGGGGGGAGVGVVVAEGLPVGSVRSAISKSFSFLSLLRRNGGRFGEGGAGLGQRGRGLKGLFSSIRWRRKPPPPDDSAHIQEVAREVVEGEPLASGNSEGGETSTGETALVLDPSPWIIEEQPAVEVSWRESLGCGVEGRSSSPPLAEEVTEDSPAPSLHGVPTEENVTEENVSEENVSAVDLTPAAVSATLGPLPEHDAMDPPSEPCVERLCSMFTDVTSLKSFDSLTGCGDIIAEPEEDSGNGAGGTSSGVGRRGSGPTPQQRSPAKPPLPPAVVSLASISPYMPAHQRVCPSPKKAQGSGIVAYMGGGEEMASPEGVDDADMQGLWHMLPQKGEDSPSLARTDHAMTRQDKRPPQVKGLRLSKIPVCGSGRAGPPTRLSPPPIHKELQDAPPSDEGYWDSPTPGPEDEDGGFVRRDILPRDSCSGDALYDLYDLDSPSAVGSDDDDLSSLTPSTGDLRMSPPAPNPSSSSSSSFRSIKGSTSLPRDSKIPISVRQTPPSHSSSQGTLSTPVSPTSHKPATKAPTRTRIPISKVPVRRSGNKNINTK
ncbi:APC membrane recruitment protein 2 [Brachyhypopomus gauderio]|uniref:APC membrane recruitment protein 2 n=1 Tax=Brachyhypopomus gauderio TaxID=698409 RepID=UPI004041E305